MNNKRALEIIEYAMQKLPCDDNGKKCRYYGECMVSKTDPCVDAYKMLKELVEEKT